MNTLFSISYLICFLYSLSKISAATDSITASQSLKDGEALVSNGRSFELGFFSPGSSNNRYLGIWYKDIPLTVVWVANRINPINDSAGSLMVNSTGGVMLRDGNNTIVWSISPVPTAGDPVLQLLDSGNLILRDNKGGNPDNYLWQSFDYPTDTLLPDMKIGWDLRTSLDRFLSSWKGWDDPSPGELTIGMERGPYPQAVMWKGVGKYYRGGPWNGMTFSGTPELKKNPVFEFEYVDMDEEVYYVFHLLNKSIISRIVLNETTLSRERYVWVEEARSWRLYAPVPRDYCDRYGLCGANGICDINASPVCDCLSGFKPNVSRSWNALDWSDGCTRREHIDCAGKHDFVRFSGLKLPDTLNSLVNKSMNLRECRDACLRNCNCMAYTNSDIRGQGSGCVLWFGDLVDVRLISGGGQDLYIRMKATNRGNRSVVMIVSITVPVSLICGLCLICYYRSRQNVKLEGYIEEVVHNDVDQKEDMDLPLLDLITVARATDNFSVNKKLGEGGFGPVYKGLLVDGQTIAVKRLSESSGQGLNEFKNEVRLIAKLQHRNLVKLLGCCIQGNEKILIYEYMPNGSLDSFLFDQTKGSRLEWSKRFNIICGIARGLLYLHQDSRLRIIHRDLKASNVLLDEELNPKISDFGMARTFGGDQSEDNTRRIVGTYGYMAPEYATYGLFSVKSDIFSFGILLMEIISGKKNRAFGTPQNHNNLIGYAWALWTEGRPLELIDPLLDDDMVSVQEMMRCVHIGLLCVQQNPDDRPSMSTVVLMLNGESSLPEPKQPGFLIELFQKEPFSSSTKNNFSITAMEGR